MKPGKVIVITIVFFIAALILISVFYNINSKRAAEQLQASITATPILSPTPAPTPSPTPAPTPTPTPVPTPTPDPGAPNIIGIYVRMGDTANRQLVTEYTAPWIKGNDIGWFDAKATNNEVLKGHSHKEIWEEYWNAFPNAANYKVGYCLTFTLSSSEVIKRTILEPDDITGFTEYIEVYIYDNIHHEPGVWYSHLLQEEMNDETLVTSIKLTAGPKISEVTDIRLMAFVYGGDSDFDPDTGDYTGNTSYEITILRQ